MNVICDGGSTLITYDEDDFNKINYGPRCPYELDKGGLLVICKEDGSCQVFCRIPKNNYQSEQIF